MLTAGSKIASDFKHRVTLYPDYRSIIPLTKHNIHPQSLRLDGSLFEHTVAESRVTFTVDVAQDRCKITTNAIRGGSREKTEQSGLAPILEYKHYRSDGRLGC